MLKLSNEQLTRLAFHNIGITNILVEALLYPPMPETEGMETEVEIDVFVVGSAGAEADEEPEALNLDALCGEWTTRRKCELLIFKAEPGYMAAWGKKPKADETGDCYLINRVDGKLCVGNGSGFVFMSYDSEKDTLAVCPGGEYTRVKTAKK